MIKKDEPARIIINNTDSGYAIYHNGTIINRKTNKIIKPKIRKHDNRLFVTIRYNKKPITKQVARWLALTYLPKPKGDISLFDADHIDGDVTNNEISNIQWLSRDENIYKAIHVENKIHRGESNGNSKLTEKMVMNILNDTLIGFTPTELALKYDIKPSIISDIRRGKTWCYLSNTYDLSKIVTKRGKCQKYSKEITNKIYDILQRHPDIKNKTICKNINVPYDNKIRCKINNIRRKIHDKSSTTIENNDDYYVIDIHCE